MRAARATGAALIASLAIVSSASARAGTLDRSFGNQGVFSAQLGQGTSPDSDFAAIAPVGDDEAVAVGSETEPNGQSIAIVARLTKNGALDPSFGTGGVVTLPAASNLTALAIAPNGDLVVAGDSNDADAVVARFNPDGTLDGTFGSGGVVDQGVNGVYPVALAVSASDQVVVVLDNDSVSNSIPNAQIERLTSTGALDQSFGQDGSVSFSLDNSPSEEEFETNLPGIGLLPSGSIVLGGDTGGNNPDGATDAVVTKLQPDGSFETHFGNDDGVEWPIGVTAEGTASGLALLPDGNILLAGGTYRAFVACLTSRGKLDRQFGTRGIASLQAGRGSSPSSNGDAIALEGGKILVAGTATTPGGGTDAFIARLTSKGHRDTKFGRDGIERIPDPVADLQYPLVSLAVSGRRALLVDDFEPADINRSASVWVAAIQIR